MRSSQNPTSEGSVSNAVPHTRTINQISPNASSSKNTGPFIDQSLSHLREEIKSVMLPLLIKVFEMKQAASQAGMPRTRLQKSPSDESPEKVRDQLQRLAEDLRQLSLWCQSCQNQVGKAVQEMEGVYKSPFHHLPSSDKSVNPAIEKSFSEALARAPSLGEPPALVSAPTNPPAEEPISSFKKFTQAILSCFRPKA